MKPAETEDLSHLTDSTCAGSKKANWFKMKFNIERRLAKEIDFVFPQSNQKLLAVTVQAHCFQ